MSPFRIRPTHWYQWINPWWWKNARIAQLVIDHWWENGGKEKLQNEMTAIILFRLPSKAYKEN